MANQIYLIAESGRPREVLEAWRESFFAAKRELRAYMDEIGADGAFRGSQFSKPSFFRFPDNNAPEGWTKPSPMGASRPKKSNADAMRRLEDLPWCEDLIEILPRELGMPAGLAYEGNGIRGFKSLCGNQLDVFSACWTINEGNTPSDIILIAPDYVAEMAKFDGCKLTWGPEGTRPEIPEGFRQVSEAEVDLIFARVRVAREKRKAAEAEAPDFSA